MGRSYYIWVYIRVDTFRKTDGMGPIDWKFADHSKKLCFDFFRFCITARWYCFSMIQPNVDLGTRHTVCCVTRSAYQRQRLRVLPRPPMSKAATPPNLCARLARYSINFAIVMAKPFTVQKCILELYPTFEEPIFSPGQVQSVLLV